jgi:AcrR family transcriptional regulator
MERPKRPETVTPEKIVAASARLFAERGYYNTTMEDIAAEVGILKGSLYHHVGSKEAILDRILIQTVSGSLGALKEIADDALPADARFDLMLRAMLRNTTENARDGTIIYATEHHRLPAGLNEKYKAVLKEQRRLFEATVRQLIAKGEASLDGDDVDIAVTTIIGLTTMTSLWYRPTGRLGLAQIEDQIVRQARRMMGLPLGTAGSKRPPPSTRGRLASAPSA